MELSSAGLIGACCLRMIRLNVKGITPISQLPELGLLVNGALSAPGTKLLVFKLALHLLLIFPRIVIHPAAGETLQPY